MNADGGHARSRLGIGGYRWTICALLFVATTVNYLDRQVLSLLAPQLTATFGWSNSDYADVTAVFQFVYAIAMVFAGRIVDRLGTKRGYLIAIVVWSLGAIVHAVAVPMGEATNAMLALAGIVAVPASVTGFMIARALLAIGEAGNFPAAIKATAEHFPPRERALATGIFNSGANVGAILAPLTVPWIALHFGWQSAFVAIGATGFVWVFFWLACYAPPAPGTPDAPGRESTGEGGSGMARHGIDPAPGNTPWWRLLAHRQTWAFATGKFLTDGVWWFYLFWLPKYLAQQYGISGTASMLPLAVLYSMTMIGSIGGGALPMRYIRPGRDAYAGRMKAMRVIALLPLVVLLAQPLAHLGYWIPVVLIGIGASAHQAWSANLFTTVSDMFPARSVASAVGIGGFAGGMGGALFSKLGGWLFDHYAGLDELATGYAIMFSLCALAYVLAWALIRLLVPAYRPVTDA